jgi:predicted protein tyrosine phosphatase
MKNIINEIEDELIAREIITENDRCDSSNNYIYFYPYFYIDHGWSYDYCLSIFLSEKPERVTLVINEKTKKGLSKNAAIKICEKTKKLFEHKKNFIPMKIVSVYKIQEMIEQQDVKYSHCISIGDPGEDKPNDIDCHFKSVLRLNFHDISSKNELPSEEHPVLPSYIDILRIIAFYYLTRRQSKGYIIHCHAGVHRSVAAGIILLFLMSRSISRTRFEIIKLKALPLPNKRMLRIFDRIEHVHTLVFVKEFEKRMRDFLENKIEINADDYLEELE